MIFCTKRGFVLLSLAIFLHTSNIAATDNENNLFPVYESIKPNIAFWKKVYSECTTSQVIVHDKRNLTLIYEVVNLKDKDEPGAQKYNKTLVKGKKNHYSKLLKRLSSGHKPSSQEEKRIHALFSDNNLSGQLKEAHDNVRVQLGQKDRFMTGVTRSGSYIEEIKEILRGHGVPEDLAYLPHVESSYNYQAYSKVGAAGIWQFTNSTGKRFMKIDYAVDERRDPILATHAAAKFLKDNYRILGSWPVALTAYNHGPQGMQRAVKAHGDYEKIYKHYNSRSFGFASRNFYAEFLAAREVAENYQKYFGEMKLNDPVKRVMIEAPGNMAIKDMAKHFKLTTGIIREYNPALREPVYSNQKYIPKGSRLFLPFNASSGIKVASIDIPPQLLKEDQKHSHFYRVRKGDTANRIARDHNVKLKELIYANQLNSRATIYVGQTLRIPSKEENTNLASSDETQNEVKVVSSEDVYTPSESTQSGSVSKAADLPEEEALAAPSAEPVIVNPAMMTYDFSVEKLSTVKGNKVGIIRAEPEETLNLYAGWLQTDTQKIKKLNGISRSGSIRVGQKIKIPLNNVSKESFEERRYEYHKELEEDFFATYKVEKTEEYTIKKGDTLWALCEEKFEIPFWLLKKYNPETDFSHLAHRQKLIIPVISKLGYETDIN